MPARATDENGLSESNKRFIETYLLNGFNITGAYMSAYPNASFETARTNGYRMFRTPVVAKEIKRRQDEIADKERIELSYLVQTLKDVIEEVKQEETERDPKSGKFVARPDRQALLKAVDILAKLSGAYAPVKQEVTGELTQKVIKIGYKKEGEEGEE